MKRTVCLKMLHTRFDINDMGFVSDIVAIFDIGVYNSFKNMKHHRTTTQTIITQIYIYNINPQLPMKTVKPQKCENIA